MKQTDTAKLAFVNARKRIREDIEKYGFSKNHLAEYYRKYGKPKFDVPIEQIYCGKCKTTNYFYDDNATPFHCDGCGLELTKPESETKEG
jgi:ribosomal protein S27E